MTALRRSCIVLGTGLLAAMTLATESIPNWSAPPSWSPARSSGITTLSETNPLPFIAITPCRIADTRGNGFTGAYGPPALTQGSPRNFTLTGRCGIPASAAAVSLNVTVTNTQGPGFILIYPQGAAQPTVSTVNYVAGQTIANAAVVPLSAGGAVTIIAGVSGTDLVLDTNGYYSQTTAGSRLASGEFLGIFGTRAGDGVIYGENNSSASFSIGVRGEATSGNGTTFGVLGQTFSATAGSAGVKGNAPVGGGSFGVIGSSNFIGVRGVSGSPVADLSFGAAGVRGDGEIGVLGMGTSIPVAGVLVDGVGTMRAEGFLGGQFVGLGIFAVAGVGLSPDTDTAGVLARDGTGFAGGTGKLSAGVRGESALHFGILGESHFAGTTGELLNGSGAFQVSGVLGYTPDGGTTKYGVFSIGNTGVVNGVKSFVEPHPGDASKVIRYVSLEGRESGTYFRGSARTVSGEAVIEVPEDFRIVTDEAGLTVQLTAIGAPPTMYVASKSLRRIVVRSEKDLEFDYLVQGVRRAYKDFEPVAEGMEFAPRSAEDRMPAYLNEENKRRLIANGTYNADGTVNVGTAERVGWTRIWKEREEQERAAAEASRAQASRPLNQKPQEQ